ncbi:class I SAM-dependent methyltransferase [Viridibacterium curvum]|uniref:Class I SAM-dependent methyltransferase n=1 Tax=Viridibacterium curvum TaxID=1101404 RepID=A0ABP9QL69_9RHOO
MTDIHCPACGDSRLLPLVDFGELPSTGVFLPSPSDGYPQRRLAFQYCAQCGCVVQVRSETHGADYTEVARGTRRQFPAYADAIVTELLTQCPASTDLLIEIGSNDGTFLTHLRQAGITNLLGVEPSRPLAEQSRANGHRVENVPLDEAAAAQIQARYGHATAVVCRHTLEHVPDPAGFLKAIRSLLGSDGLLFIEVPSVAPILDERLQGYELWDEHLSYFSERNLACLLQRSGFEIRSMQSREHCGSDNILCWAAPVSVNAATHSAADGALVSACASFADRWHAFSKALQQKLGQHPQPVFAMGASHPQTNFLHFTGLMPMVSGLLDDDPFKLGKWVPAGRAAGSGRPVIAAKEVLGAARGGTVLLTGFGYPNWMRSVMQSLEGSGICALACDTSDRS